MTTSSKYDVFLSYRREGADGTARLIYDRLTHDGYRVAYDLETLRPGNFDEQILETIRQCRDFVIVLSPNALARCSDPEDWVRREVACALACGCNVIPVMLRGFEFPPPSSLPEDIRDLPRKQAIDASTMKRLDGTIKELESFLKAWPVRRIARKMAVWGLNAAVALCFGAAAAAWVASTRHAPRLDAKETAPAPERAALAVQPGYRLAPSNHGESASLVWDAGAPYPDAKWPHVHAARGEGQWQPDKGFRFSNSNPDDFSVVPNTVKQEAPFTVDCSSLSEREKLGLVSNLFYSLMKDTAVVDLADVDDQQLKLMDFLAKSFDNPALLRFMFASAPDAETALSEMEKLVDDSDADLEMKEKAKLLFSLLHPLCFGFGDFEKTLNDLYDSAMGSATHILYRGHFHDAWLAIPRWPAQKPDFGNRIDLSGLSLRDKCWLSILLVDAALDSYRGTDFRDSDGLLSEDGRLSMFMFNVSAACGVSGLLEDLEKDSFEISDETPKESSWKNLLDSDNADAQLHGLIEGILLSRDTTCFGNLNETLCHVERICLRHKESCLRKGKLRDLWEDAVRGKFPPAPPAGEKPPLEYEVRINDDPKSVDIVKTWKDK